MTKLYVNNGAGVFTDSNVSLTPVAAGDLAWGDFDNDGDFDLALAGQAASGRILEIYRNQSGTFEQVSMDVLVGVDFAAITWADYDNDGDLDLISSGRASPTATSFLPASRVNDNLESRFNPKRRPSPPTALVATTQGSEVFLVWNPSTNVSTPGEALTYAVRVGTEPGGSQIRSGAAPLRNGRIQHNNYFLTGLKSGRYFWAARAIDKALLSSLWSEEQSFIVDIDKPVVDSISVRPRTFGASANRATVVIAFRDEPAGMDNAVSPQVSLHLAGDGPQLSVRQLSFSGNLWIGEADISDPTPSGTAIVRVEAARDLNGNQMDPFEQVIAALVLPGAGGVIESNDGLVRLTIFPSAQSAGLPENPSIEIRSRGVDAPPNGAVPVGLAYEVISTPAFTPSKDATLAFTYPAAGTDPALLAVYRLEGTIWTRLGGTVDVAANQVRIPVGQLGTFALFQDNSATSGQASVTNIGFSNRAFSPGRSGRGPARLASPLYGSTDISFTLGATSTVRIEIYNRSGRLQRVLETGRQMGPGQQVITWDGQNQDGNIVRSGLYIVVIEADGKKAHSTLAVVNN